MRFGVVVILVATAVISAIAGVVPLAQLHVTIVDAFGAEVRGSVRVGIYEDDGLIAEATGASPRVLNAVPYGRYRLEIMCTGFRMVSRTITVSERNQALRVGLELAKVGDPQESGLVLSGTVVPCLREPSMWVKVVGVFTDEAAETKVGTDCGFRIPDLAGGRYVGFLVDGEAVKDIKVIKLTVGSQTVVFSTRGEP
jgi:hypothetical protein